MASNQQDQVDQLASANPRVDVEAVREGLHLIEVLRAAGVRSHEYNLTSPYGSESQASTDEFRRAPVGLAR